MPHHIFFSWQVDTDSPRRRPGRDGFAVGAPFGRHRFSRFAGPPFGDLMAECVRTLIGRRQLAASKLPPRRHDISQQARKSPFVRENLLSGQTVRKNPVRTAQRSEARLEAHAALTGLLQGRPFGASHAKDGKPQRLRPVMSGVVMRSRQDKRKWRTAGTPSVVGLTDRHRRSSLDPRQSYHEDFFAQPHWQGSSRL